MPNISIMIKPASSLCNLRCKYCFYNSISDIREVKSFGIMESDTSENIILKAIELANGGNIYFAFQGGEPLFAGLDYFKHFVQFFNTHKKKCTVSFSLQTNGTLINDEWAKFFFDNKFLIGLSLDGNQTTNRFRRTSDLGYAYPQIINGLELLKKYNVEFNILIVATGYIADHIEEVLDYFKKNKLKYLQFIPCLRPFDDKSEGELYMTEKQYFHLLDYSFNFYCNQILKENDYYSIRYFDNLVNLYLTGQCEQCGILGHCAHQFVVEGNGNVYPCDFFCLDEWLLGNINDNSSLIALSKTEKAISFIKESILVPDKCKSCNVYPICRSGGCKRQRLDRDYCGAYKTFFLKNASLFAALKQHFKKV